MPESLFIAAVTGIRWERPEPDLVDHLPVGPHQADRIAAVIEDQARDACGEDEKTARRDHRLARNPVGRGLVVAIVQPPAREVKGSSTGIMKLDPFTPLLILVGAVDGHPHRKDLV